MLFVLIALFFVGSVAILEYATGQKRHYTNYLTWFLLILAALYAGKAYGVESSLEEALVTIDEEVIEPPTFEEH